MAFLDFQSSALPTELSCLNHVKYYAGDKVNGKRVRARLTHHSLRHLFATRCVESGIDIPTVARTAWASPNYSLCV